MSPSFAILDDLPLLTKWGREFHSHCPYSSVSERSDTAIRDYLAWHIQSTSACVIKTDDGMIGGVLQPALDYADGLVARETFMWSEGRNGDMLRLLKSLENWAEQRGAQFIEISSLFDGTGERLQKVFERKGYEGLQKTFRKKLK